MPKKIFTTARVKNEDDIIESFVRYNLTYCDGMLINDNGSIDNTKEIIQKLMDEGLPLYWCDTGVKTKMALVAVKEYKADLVVALDADEFLYHIDGENPRGVLESLNENAEYQAFWRTYIYEKEPDISLGFMPNNFNRYRNPVMENQENGRWVKAIVSRKLLLGKSAEYGYGGHFLKYPEEYQESIMVSVPEKLVYAHFPIRSKAQIMNKAITGWLTKCKLSRPDEKFMNAIQTGVLFNKLKTYGEIPQESLTQCSIEYSLHPDLFTEDETETGNREKLDELINSLGDKITISGPMDTSFCSDRLLLRYTAFNSDKRDIIRVITNEIYATLMYLYSRIEQKDDAFIWIRQEKETLERKYFQTEKQYFQFVVNNMTRDTMIPPHVVFYWLDTVLKDKGMKLIDWLLEHSIKSIAIYGMGYIGKRIAKKIMTDKENSAAVDDLHVFLLDTNKAGDRYMSCNIQSPDEFKTHVDAMLITVADPLHIKEIKSAVNNTDINYDMIITLYDLLKSYRLQ